MVAVAGAVAAAVAPARRTSRPNVVLVSIDTLRADHLGCYGYARPTSPRIDAFSSEAILFEQAVAMAPSTLPSHASIFTSLIVPHHGASFRDRTPLSPDHVTLAEVLHDRGYATLSWNGGAQLDPVFGLGQGFEEYHSFQESAPGQEPPGGPSDADRLSSAVHSALQWLDARSDARPFFFFLHSYEVHHPYAPDPDLRALFGRFPTRLGDRVSIDDLRRFNDGVWTLEPGDLAHIVASYDAEIRSADRAFGELIHGLKARGLDSTTMVVLTSDHGEEFAEHGRVGWHSHTLFDELLLVPLIIRLPGAEHGGTRVGAQVRGIDVAPTILDVAGIRAPAVFEGKSLQRTRDSPDAETSRPALCALDGGRRVAVRDGGWKWIQRLGLYDLRSDPRELDRNPSRGMGRRRAELRRLAERWRVARPLPPSPPAGVDLDEELEDRLNALGYVDEP